MLAMCIMPAPRRLLAISFPAGQERAQAGESGLQPRQVVGVEVRRALDSRLDRRKRPGEHGLLLARDRRVLRESLVGLVGALEQLNLHAGLPFLLVLPWFSL